MYTLKRSEIRRRKRRKYFRRVACGCRMLFPVCGAFAVCCLIFAGLMSKAVLAAQEHPESAAEEPAGADMSEYGKEGSEEKSAAEESGKKGSEEKSAAEETEKEAEDEPLLIAVDAGHGGMDSGCLGSGVTENEINLQIALLTKKKLEDKGFQVMMPRQNDELLSKEERVELANSYQADAYISIHQNTYEGSDKSVSGIETWYDGKDSTRDNRRLAILVHRETLGCTGARERGLIDSGELYVTSKTLMPACLIETGFLSNPQECTDLSSPAYQERIAEGIAEGVYQYFYPEKAERFFGEHFL